MRHSYMVCWFISVGAIVYHSLKCPDGPELPWPPQLIAPAIAFGMLDIFGSFVDERLASVIAVGLLLAAIISKKGVAGACGKQPCATAQPASYVSLQPIQYSAPGYGQTVA